MGGCDDGGCDAMVARQWFRSNGCEEINAPKRQRGKGQVSFGGPGYAIGQSDGRLCNRTAGPGYAIGWLAPAMQSDGQPGYAIGWPAPAMQLEGRPRLCNWMASPGYAIGWPAQAMQSVATTRVMQSDPAVRRCTARAIPGQVMMPCHDGRPGPSPAKE